MTFLYVLLALILAVEAYWIMAPARARNVEKSARRDG